MIGCRVLPTIILPLALTLGCDQKDSPTTKTQSGESAAGAATADAAAATANAAANAADSVAPATESAKVAPDTPEDDRVAAAQKALMPLKKSLMGALSSSMAKGGPEAAIEVCHTKAPSLTTSSSTQTAKVGRSALLLRNPENTAPAWAEPLMLQLSKLETPAGQHRSSELPDGGFGYVETIATLPLCLTCHGKTLAPNVTNLIDEKYPNDKARGFETGSFRGIFWVELAAPETQPQP